MQCIQSMYQRNSYNNDSLIVVDYFHLYLETKDKIMTTFSVEMPVILATTVSKNPLNDTIP